MRFFVKALGTLRNKVFDSHMRYHNGRWSVNKNTREFPSREMPSSATPPEVQAAIDKAELTPEYRDLLDE